MGKKLYLLTQSKNTGYDTYDSAIVCAINPLKAKCIHPSGERNWDGKEGIGSDWPDIEFVSVKLIGNASNDVKLGLVLSSFNAG